MILLGFAIVVGSLTVHRIRSDFYRQVSGTAAQLPAQLNVYVNPANYTVVAIQPSLAALAAPEHAVIKIVTLGGAVIAQTPSHAPALGLPQASAKTIGGYRVISRPSVVRISGSGEPLGEIFIQYARRLSDVDATVARVELLLLLGVLTGAGLALLAGMTIARRAMAPIVELTGTAAAIARTRDPSRSVPQPEADDEVGELARTLRGMLHELDVAHAETERMLARQRQFVADASHELRTPLTSVLANLELLADRSDIGQLQGDQWEAARSALRSSQRMHRLVADLLLLARTDVGRPVPHEPVDLAQIVVEATAELGPVSSGHEISLDVHPAIVEASRDELHRLVINLLENALRHTPDGTEIWVSTNTAGGEATLVVEDDGPGVPAQLVPTLFERFVRGAGDRGGSFGLGLAIVEAVVSSHGGSVAVESSAREGVAHGARFVVRLPAATPPPANDPERRGERSGFVRS